LVTGDLVDDAQEDQYVACAAALTPFAGRLLACPGNHDVARLGDVYDAGSLDLDVSSLALSLPKPDLHFEYLVVHYLASCLENQKLLP
jgi:hypothetical protein